MGLSIAEKWVIYLQTMLAIYDNRSSVVATEKRGKKLESLEKPDLFRRGKNYSLQWDIL